MAGGGREEAEWKQLNEPEAAVGAMDAVMAAWSKMLR